MAKTVDGKLFVGVRIGDDVLFEVIPDYVMRYEDDELDSYCYMVQKRLLDKLATPKPKRKIIRFGKT